MVFLFLLQHRIFGAPSEHTIDVQLEAVPEGTEQRVFDQNIVPVAGRYLEDHLSLAPAEPLPPRTLLDKPQDKEPLGGS